MSNHDQAEERVTARRGVLTGGMAGLAAIAGTASQLPQAAAQTAPPPAAAPSATPPATAEAPAKPPGFDGMVFLNPHEAATVEAISERIWPSSRTGPGARAAGAVHYIDRALDGAYARHQATYRRGIGRLERAAHAEHGRWFPELSAAQQDALLTRLEKNEVQGFRPDQGRAFFDLLRTHTMEGVLSDPMYGGNRDFVGWKVVGYPGPYYQITPEEQQRVRGPVELPRASIADL